MAIAATRDVDSTDPADVIVLYGPTLDAGSKAYGGGMGGYVRNAALLCEAFVEYGPPHLRLCGHSVRGHSWYWPLLLPLRFVGDVMIFLRDVDKGAAVHLMLQYRTAIYREFAISIIASLFDKPVLVDIRAGRFLDWFSNASAVRRWMARRIVRNAKIVLCQGRAATERVGAQFNVDAHHFPNFVPRSELGSSPDHRCRGKELRVLFVGYCYPPKGILEVVEGCEFAAARGTAIRLTIVGAETEEFKHFMDGRAPVRGLTIIRCGRVSHERVMDLYTDNDVFCLPTWHPGEGHSNVITEAMIKGLVIVTTRHGYIPEIIDEDAAYFVQKRSATAVGQALEMIDHDREEARLRASKSQARAAKEFTDQAVLPQLRTHYVNIVSRSFSEDGPL
jgi:glycosyltransferase involved in cell wall biosynthesis